MASNTDLVVQDTANLHKTLSLSSRRASSLSPWVLFRSLQVMDSPELLRRVVFHVPVGPRLLQLFSRNHHITAYAYHSIVLLLIHLGIAAQFDYSLCNASVLPVSSLFICSRAAEFEISSILQLNFKIVYDILFV